MSLIQCPDCNAQVSDRAPTCPTCACPIAAPPPSLKVEARERRSREAPHRRRAKRATRREPFDEDDDEPYALGPEVYRDRRLLRRLPEHQLEEMAQTDLQRFPVALTVLLHFVTLGIFTHIYFAVQHGRLPRVAHDDFGGGQAFGFLCIPLFNFYWIFNYWLRLCDRLDLQYRLREEPPRAPRGLAMAASIFAVIPYINLLLYFPLLAPILAGMLQARINELAEE